MRTGTRFAMLGLGLATALAARRLMRDSQARRGHRPSSGRTARDAARDQTLEDTFPASDPPSIGGST